MLLLKMDQFLRGLIIYFIPPDKKAKKEFNFKGRLINGDVII